MKQVDFIIAYFNHLKYHFKDEKSGWNSPSNTLCYTDNNGQDIDVMFNRETEVVFLIKIKKFTHVHGWTEETIFSGSFDQFIEYSNESDIRDFKLVYLMDITS
jgi:hypothetical protein